MTIARQFRLQVLDFGGHFAHTQQMIRLRVGRNMVEEEKQKYTEIAHIDETTKQEKHAIDI